MIAEKRKLFFFILIAGLHSPYQSGVQTVMPCFADQWTAVGRWRCIPMGTVVFRNRMRCVCTPCPPPLPSLPPFACLAFFCEYVPQFVLQQVNDAYCSTDCALQV